ncbi:MAG: VIT domain-containing protein [Candidatus Bipolaricaulota bacterium]
MRQLRIVAACAVVALWMVLSSVGTQADGILLPDDPGLGPFDIVFHDVEVTIRDGIVTTRVDEIFRNSSLVEREARYIFPLPPGAVVSEFTLWIDGQAVEAELLGAEEARSVYEDYVRRATDPALLEYIGRDTLMARIFPVPASGERRIQISYSELLSLDSGAYRYRYPLDTERFSASPIERVTISVELSTTLPLAAVYSPTHDLNVVRRTDGTAVASYETHDARPADDFVLYYTVGLDVVGTSILTYRVPGEDGFFLFLATPPQGEAGDTLPKDLVFVLDRSGSMQGEKFRQAQEALAFILANLGSADRFALLSFSSSVDAFATKLCDATEIPSAQAWVWGQEAAGSTDIDAALRAALSLFDGSDRPRFLIFLTDGEPTAGVVDPVRIAERALAANVSDARLFVFGVGYDVNTVLLDQLARENRGTTAYVLPEEDLELVLSGFYRKIASPVLANPVLAVDGVGVYDVLPAVLPDVFRGSQLVALGRYRGEGEARVTLSGDQSGLPLEISSTHLFPSSSLVEPTLARLWAGRKVATLLEQIRLYGEDKELVDEVIAWSERYGIITPYTSFLVEETGYTADEAADAVFRAAAPASGSAAVQGASALKSLAEGEVAAPPPAETLRIVGDRAYFLRDGVWTDSEFDEEAPVIEVQIYSEAYFELPTLAAWIGPHLALGTRVVVKVGEVFVWIDEVGKTTWDAADRAQLSG